MRVLFVLPYLPSPIRVRPYELIRQLANRHELSVLAVGDAGGADAERLRHWCQEVQAVPFQPFAGLWSCAVAAVRGEPLQAAICQSAALRRQLEGLLRERSFDLVHVEHLRAANVWRSIPEHLPTVFDAVDCISLLHERTLRSSHSLGQRALAALELDRTRAFEARLLERFDRVMVTSADDRRALRALAPGAQVEVVPNGVDLDSFRPLHGRREPATLVFSGKMSYHANVTALLHFVRQILPLVRCQVPDARLRVVGSDPPRSVRDLARDPAITVTGYVSDMPAALGSATVAVAPMLVQVGIQNKLLEAMAMGLPVVATSAAVKSLGAQPGRDLLVADAPTAFAAQICRLLGDAALRQQVSQQGYRYVQTWHRWETAAARVERLYQRAAEGRAGARLAARPVPYQAPQAV